MQVRLHKNATTTPKTRALIQASSEPNTLLAQRFGVGVDTIARWKHRDSTEDRSHTPHRLSTTYRESSRTRQLSIESRKQV